MGPHKIERDLKALYVMLVGHSGRDFLLLTCVLYDFLILSSNIVSEC